MHDKDAKDVIALMNNLLLQDEASPSSCKEGSHSLHEFDFDKEFGSLLCNSELANDNNVVGEFNVDGKEDEEFGSLLCNSKITDGILADEFTFDGENVADLFRSMHDQTQLKASFQSWRGVCVERKGQRCRSFGAWKKIVRDKADKANRSVLRFRRQQKLRRARRILSVWQETVVSRSALLNQISSNHGLKVKTAVFSRWKDMTKASRRILLVHRAESKYHRPQARVSQVKANAIEKSLHPKGHGRNEQEDRGTRKTPCTSKGQVRGEGKGARNHESGRAEEKGPGGHLEHRRFLEEKRQQARNRANEIARRKDQMRAAINHSNRLLKRRCLKRWTLIFDAKAFNERKACLAWQDRTLEKVYLLWKGKALDLRQSREQLEIDRHNQAVSFYNRSLVSKAWAAWEDFSIHKREQSEHLLLQMLKSKKGAVMRAWKLQVVDMQEVRTNKERIADEHRKGCLKAFVLNSWANGAALMQEERRIDALVQEKWKQVDVWLDQASF
ncbi:hypothetical protein THAOC_25369 [Thalassiosira oceanica]|uniref:Sfi1 spindle body domain-containing protein n=1 Tax=Thalassiosira oceanica TaxID=159749 RepID=K0S803_THAOC|nr:hypothetical protein THAOC_25369 [Thalassiosira oceanica]|eukprot:EJK54957.1 hypothetical protein THAOC_25369 [Thalassiosira oceanica]